MIVVFTIEQFQYSTLVNVMCMGEGGSWRLMLPQVRKKLAKHLPRVLQYFGGKCIGTYTFSSILQPPSCPSERPSAFLYALLFENVDQSYSLILPEG